MKRQGDGERSRHEVVGPSPRERFFLLALIMIASSLVSTAIVTGMLYRHNIEEHREQLQVTVQSQAALIEAVALYDAKMAGIRRLEDPDHDSFAATLSQLIDAHERYQGFGATGEFTMARHVENSIVFVLRHRYSAVERPAPVAFDSDLAEPMRLALRGLSGTVVGLDYRGVTVLAAYEPVPVLGLGIVAKIDMAEIRIPFIRAGLLATAVAFLAVMAGTVLFIRVGNPIVERFEAQSRDLLSEIKERTQTEEKLRASNRALTVLSECNQVLVRATTESDLLRDTCRLIVNTGGYHRAWVGMAEQDEGKSIRAVAQCGYDEGYLDTLDLTWADTERGRGPTSSAIRTCLPFAARLILTDAKLASWREAAIEHGYASSIALPLMAGGRAFGALNVYSTQADAFDIKEEELLQELADDLAYGVESLRVRQEHKRAEERATRFNRVLEGSLNEIYIIDAGTLHFVEVNRGARENTGYSMEELRDLRPVDLKPEFTAESFGQLVEPLRTGEQVQVHFATIHRRKDGSVYPVDVYLQLMTDGDPVFVAIILDITQRRRAEEELHASELRFRSLFEDVPISLWEEDFSDVLAHLEGLKFREIEDFEAYLDQHPEVTAACSERVRVTALNRATLELHEAATVEDLLGRFPSTLTERRYLAFKQHLVAIWQGHTEKEMEAEIKTLSGVRRQVMIRWSVPAGYQKTLSRVLVSLTDITKIKAAEDTIRALATDLERRVAERTEELEAANRELESFSYSVSHDLKAPLRAIDGYSGKLEQELDELLNPEGRRLLGVVRQKAQHMGRLIEALLTFSRIGRAELSVTEVDMGTLAQTTFVGFAAMHGEREITFSVGDLPTVAVDRDLMRQVWVNLLNNAIKFTNQRDVARIDVGYREEPGQHVFYVRDNGAGFDMAYVDKLFGVFQRLHYEGDFPGTGVGLANVRRIVERHGGDVWAEGEVDHGATFFFRLPHTARTT